MADRREALLGLAAAAAMVGLPRTSVAASGASAYDFGFTAIDGTPLPLAQFRGKVLLVVNTASFCGFTDQYAGLQSLWQQRKGEGVVVLGVPSNDFGGQEPGSNAKIKEFCDATFAVEFPMTEKVAVRGPDRHPLYGWIRNSLGPREGEPRWNFHKFLIDRSGQVVAGFPSTVTPQSPAIARAIDGALR